MMSLRDTTNTSIQEKEYDDLFIIKEITMGKMILFHLISYIRTVAP